MKKICVFIIAFIFATVMLAENVFAFDANDYDYGGGGGYSYDNDYDYSYSYDNDDDDYSYSRSHSYGENKMTWEETLITVGVVVVVLVLGYIWATRPSKKNRKKGAKGSKGGNVIPANGGQGAGISVPDRTGAIRDAMLAVDPSFDNKAFLDFAKNVFFGVQNAWCARDLEPVRSVMHTNLYNTTSRQVQSKIDQHVTFHYENMRITNAYLTSLVRDNEYEYITVYVQAQFVDYQTDDNTGNIIRGDRNTVWSFRYLMKFMRSVGGASGQPKTCPNCGAPLNMSSTGRCEYCGSTVTTGSFDWLLSDFTTVRNDTRDDGIRI